MSEGEKIDLMVKSGAMTPEQGERAKKKAEIEAGSISVEDRQDESCPT